MANELMFQIGIQEVKEKIDDIRKKFDDFEKTYGQNGITVKLNLQGAVSEAETLIGALKNIGSAESLKPYESELGKVKQQMEQVANASKTAADANKKASETSADSVNKENIDKQRQLKLLAEVRDMYMKVAETSSATSGVSARTIKETEQQYASLLAKLSTIPPKTPIQEIAAEFSALKSSTKGFFNEIKQGSKAVDSIRLVRLALKQVNEQINSGKSSPQLEGLREQLQAINKEMHNMMKAGNYGGIQSLFAGHKGMSDGVVNMIRQAVSEMNKLGASTQSTAAITSQLTSEEQRLASAIGHSTGEMRGQSQVLSDLKSMAMQYVSVWGASNFLHNIIEIGGQLEKQRLSIGAILGDISHANDLFGKIKNLAIKSPFGVVELDQFTKQLSAYGFKYNELYDMTKRLADIAAGAGTDVSRLTLAIGHVRAEGALTGYTLRQFAMNNIPMVSELAKKLSEVEHRVVTVADVRKRVRNKEIGYEDVIDVIKNLTNEGGMFYDMQETISQSIQSRFKNLRDSLDIMYGEIAESGIGDALKEVAVILTDMSRNWKSFIPIIESSVLAWGTYKAATLAVSMAMGKNTMAVTSNMLAYKKKRAEELFHDSMVRKLTAEEERLVATRNKLTAENIRVAMTTGAMTKADALKLVALRKVDLETTKALIHMDMFTAAEARMALNGRLLWMNLGKVGASLKLFGASAWSSIKGLAGSVFTPLNAAFAALTIGMSAKQRQDEFKEVREQRRNTINERANEGYKNLLEATKNFSVGSSVNMTKTDINLSLDEMMEKLKEYSMFYNTTFNDAFKVNEQGYAVHSLAEQYEILAKGLEDAANAHKMFAENRDWVTHALETSDPSNGFWKNVGDTLYGWLLSDDTKAQIGSLSDSLERYAQTTREVGVAENLLLRDHIALRTALDGRALGDVMNMTNEELIRTLSRLRSTMPDVFAAVRLSLSAESRAMLDDWTVKCNSMNEAYAASNLKMRKAGNDLYESMKVQYGGDMTKWPSEWREFVFMAMDAATKDVKGFSDMSIEYQNLVRDSFLKPFNISVDSDEAKEKVNDLYTDLQNLVGKTWTIKIGVKGESAWDDLETAGKKFQENDKKVKQLEKNLKRLNYTPGSYLNSREAEKVAEEYNDAIAERRAAKILYESYGGDVSELDKEKNKKKGGKGSGEDKDAKELRERMRILKEAADAYKYWKKAVGEGGAEAHVNEEFGDVMAKLGYTFKDIKQFRETIMSEVKKYEDIYNKSGKKRPQLLEAIKEGYKTDAGLNRNEFEETAEEFASKVQIELDSLTRAWEVFNNVREATGNVELAVQLSGADYSNGKTRNLADALREKIQKDFDEAGGGIAFDINLSDKDIEDKIKAAVPAASEKQIKGLVDEYKKWRDLQRDVLKNDLDMFYKLIGSAVDLQSQLQKVTDEYAKQIAALDELKKSGKITNGQYNQAKAIADANLQMKTVQAKKEYQFLMDGVVTMTKESARTIKEEYVNALKRQLAAGVITAKEYADKIDEVNNRMRELEYQKSDNMAYMQGGIDGLVNNKKRRGMSMIQEGGALQQEAQSEIDGIFKNGGSFDDFMNSIKKMNTGKEMESAGQGLSEFANGMGETIDQVGAIVHGINNVVQGVKAVLDEIDEMNAALGDHGSQYDGSRTFFNAFSSASQKATNAFESLKSGDYMGTFAGIVGSFTQWVTVYAKAHDADLDRQIELAEQELKVLSNIDSRLDTQISRTLGGATRAEIDERTLQRYLGVSELRNKLRDPEMFGEGFYEYVFTQTGRVLDNMSKETREAVSTASKNKSAISAQYASLLEQRDLVQRQLDAERDKKDSDESAIEEYQQKLYELEDQIQYFVEDVAKELYGLDLKGWASQIGDALMTAFENGEDAAKAFEETTKDILRSVASEMIKLNIIEPAMAGLRQELFGIDSNGNKVGEGVYDTSTGRLDEEKTIKILGEYFGDEGALSKSIEAAEEFYNLFQKLSGFDLSSTDSSKYTGSSIKGITENTADLLASYLNAIRADVSVDRNMIAQYYPMFIQAMTKGNTSLVNIENHTAAIMRSNDEIKQSVSDMYILFIGLKNRTWKMPMA